MLKMHHLFNLISWILLKLGQRSLYHLVDNILQFILNIKQSLSDKWLLGYRKNNLGAITKIVFYLTFGIYCFVNILGAIYSSKAVL